jgi:predicted alpha/beta hydrolase family esterase
MNRIQVFVIHGGMTFKNQRDYVRYLKNKKVTLVKKPNWAMDYLEKKLGNHFQVIRPRMPLQDNAKYEDWKIMFERYIPHLNNNVILIGNSLGGIFLAKYLSEHTFPKKILATHMTGAPFDGDLPTEDLAGGFILGSDLSLLEKNSKHLYLHFSKDDDVVPVSHAKKYAARLKTAKIIVYTDKNGHFDVPTFPQIIKMIKTDAKELKTR